MYVNLNNISFYRQPPPPKPPLSSLPTPRWMPYQAPPASQCLSHPLPPKPPIPAASTVPTLASRQNLVQQLQTSIREDIESHITTVRNEFDVELERISIAGNTRTVHEADLERSGDHGFHNGGVTDVHPKPNTSSIGSMIPKLAQPQASASGSGETASQSTPEQDILQEQPDRGVCRSVEAGCYSDPAFTGAELECPGPSVVMELHRDSILSSRASTKTNASLSVVSDHSAYTSQSPAADISDLSDTTPHPRGVSPAETIQCDETVVEDAINEVASRGDQAEYLSNKAVLTQSVQNDRPSIEKSSPPSDAEDNVSKEVRPSVLSRPNHQSCPIGLSEIPLPCTRSLRPRPNTNADKISKEVRLPELSHSNHQSRPIGPLKMPSKRTRSLRPRPNIHIDRPERLPSVSVVIPVRESDRLMASATKDPPIQVRRHVQQDGSGDNNTNSSTAAPDFNNDRSCSEIERPRKRCKHAVRPRKAAETDSTSTNHAIRETKNSFRNSSGSGFGTPDEAQEVFGRGILRIQPHGPRHTYFITFLPDNVYHLPPRPDMPPRQSSCPEGRPQSQSSRQTIHRRRHKRSPYSPAENQLLTELRSRRCLPWREVAKHFKHRTQASLQVQYSKIRSESLDKI